MNRIVRAAHAAACEAHGRELGMAFVYVLLNQKAAWGRAPLR